MSPAASFSALDIGTEIERTITVGEAHFRGAEELFGDDHPIHTSDDYARERGHPSRTLPGTVIGGIMSSSLSTMLRDCGLALLEYNVRYRAPVYVGAVLTSRCRVVRREPKPHRGGGLVFFELTLHDGEGTLVAEATAVDLVADAPV
jgi:3-hydroxybutyryl-CoA dehydratase